MEGTGGATFDNGQTTRVITETSALSIRGTDNSSDPANMRLSAREVSMSFCVRTWPINFRETDRGTLSDGGISFLYEWDSESGSAGDLTDIGVGESISCDQTPMPPYDEPYAGYPSSFEFYPAATPGWFRDEHLHKPFRTPYSATTHNSTQFYGFHDWVLGEYHTLSGSIGITRTTYQSGNWVYHINKQGNENSTSMP